MGVRMRMVWLGGRTVTRGGVEGRGEGEEGGEW